MARQTAHHVLDERDQRLIAALQCDGRLTAERAGEVLGISPRSAHRRWGALIADRACRVIAMPARPDSVGALFLRIRVLGGRLDALTAALAARSDVAFIDVSASGDEILAISCTRPGTRDHLVFRDLPATRSVTSVSADTVLHVFAEASDWRHSVLSDAERAALTPVRRPDAAAGAADAVDRDILAALEDDARASAAAVAARTGHPDSTVRRRIARLSRTGRLLTHVVVDPKRLGLFVDADVMMRVAPDRLDSVGRALAAHPAVHGAFATTGTSNLQVAVWLRDLEDLYRFVTRDLGGLGVDGTETVLVGHAVKRPGKGPAGPAA
ncbi:AsnC family transcriptional regulator [Streptomyces glomeratus]|uniref:HTH asnC-type domain-containing protein n=1 Tax=Streptomyces glomeratus TaxID=284452 RepID=A0ABP6LL19_9ACTN|nr:AsnC family transcriptional regulator [Streptomyces glomeratus]MCF1509236.1 Lrp/AsnC family transcriptional regulator [Streptomyces glomeratus]